MFCPNCGKEINNNDNFCSYCGYALQNNATTAGYNNNSKRKSKLIAGLLQILLPFGVGRFYLGYTGIGIAQLLLSFIGVGAIWSVIDGVMILVGNLDKDADGVPLED